MSGLVVLLDANVIYPAPLRDVFVQMVSTGIIRARWTNEIHEEWIAALLQNEPQRRRASLERTRDFMNDAVRDCLVTNYQRHISKINLPDPNDRHVLAAAIEGKCQFIVTNNLKDFPAKDLKTFNIVAISPDAFIHGLLSQNSSMVAKCLQDVRARLIKPPITENQYLDILERQG